MGQVVDLADFTFYFTSVLMLDANPDAIEKENWNWQKQLRKSIDISTTTLTKKIVNLQEKKGGGGEF